jgi:hypothetical protein
MNVNHDVIQYSLEEQPFGEIHDPAEESELIYKIRTLPMAEARKMAREFGVPWKEVVAHRRGVS